MRSDDLIHLLAEVCANVPPDKSTLPDTPEVRDMRAKLKKNVDEIHARGHSVDIPYEWE